MTTNQTKEVLSTIKIGNDRIDEIETDDGPKFSLNGGPLYDGAIIRGAFAGAVGESAVRRFTGAA